MLYNLHSNYVPAKPSTLRATLLFSKLSSRPNFTLYADACAPIKWPYLCSSQVTFFKDTLASRILHKLTQIHWFLLQCTAQCTLLVWVQKERLAASARLSGFWWNTSTFLLLLVVAMMVMMMGSWWWWWWWWQPGRLCGFWWKTFPLLKPLMMKLQIRELLWISGGFSSVTPQLPLLSQTVQLPKHKMGFETVHSCWLFIISQNYQGPFGAKII